MTAHREPPQSTGVRHPARVALHGGRPTARWLIRRWYDVRVHHPERFPASGPVIVSSNHIGFVDGPLLGIFAPRPVHALTKQEMFHGALGGFLRVAGQISVDRFRPDPRAVRACLRVLRSGGVVGVFPEGTRGNGELDRFHRGAAYLALVTGAPIVPVTIVGSREPGGHTGSLPPRRSRIDLVLGSPVHIDAVPWPRNKNHVAECSLELRDLMLAELRTALDETGRRLPGPLPAGEHEPLPGNLVERPT